MQDPLKQGLKHKSRRLSPRTYPIRMQDPLKQGLKHPSSFNLFKMYASFECKIH